MKLASGTIYIIGASVAIAALSYGYFQEWMPNTAETANYKARVEELQQEANKQKKANERVLSAVKLVEGEAAKWRAVVATRAPRPSVAEGGINLNVNAWQLGIDSRKFRNNVQRAVNAQVKRGGVRVVNGPLVPAPNGGDLNASSNGLLASYYNLQEYGFPIVIFNLGTVTVEGTYKQILDNVRSWANMPRYLAIADGLAITGTTPRFTGTYNLQVVGFIRGNEIYPVVPEGTAGAPGGVNGSFGGPGGPGGPPVGFGPSGRPSGPGGGGAAGPSSAPAGVGGGR